MKPYTIIAVMVIVLTYPLFVFAQNPSVVSFVASPTSINYGQPVDFIWTLKDAGGYSFLIPCVSGIKLKNPDGSTPACDNRYSSTKLVNDSFTVFITNISGGARTVTARIIPKNSSGQDYDAGAQDTSVSVNTLSQPITSFSTATTSVQSAIPVTISWTSKEIEGINVSFECRDEIQVSSPNYTSTTFIPCGNPVFSSDLSPNNSLTLNFINSSPYTIPYKITLLPAISSKVYDGTKAATLTLDIASNISPDPEVLSFTSSAGSINSGETINLSWVTEKSAGANLKISCLSSFTATSSKNPSALLSCDTPAFSETLGASGTVILRLNNKETYTRNATMTLLPLRKSGGYDSTRSKKITVEVKPEQIVSTATAIVQSVPAPAPTPAATSPQIQTQKAVPPTAATVKTVKIIFTQPLKRGSKGLQVNSLQEFLKKDASIYPEGIVNGIFGPATERAVKRFQKKYGLASEGIPGYGSVGPKTRAKLNEIQ